MDDRNFDDATARAWIQMVEAPGSRREAEIYPRLRDWLARVAPSHVLEIGAGQGVCSAQVEVAYTGVEPSPLLLERARQLYPDHRKSFLAGDAYALPVPDASQSAAFSVLVWHLLGDLGGAARELSRVLRPGGAFCIVTANPRATEFWERLYTHASWMGPRLEGTMASGERDVLYFPSLEELTGSFQQAGLAVERIETLWSEAMVWLEGTRV